MQVRWALLLVAAGIAVAGCGGAAPHRTPVAAPGAPTTVVVDTDMSTDDILALLYLLGRRDVDVRAVAVSGTGLVDCPAGARNARALLAAAGRRDLPVGCGRDEPLSGANAFPPEWRERADQLFGVALPTVARAAPHASVDVLRGALQSTDRKATVLVLGPMTDVAQLLREHPDLRSRIGAVVAMGGAVGVPGNIGPGHERAEWNLWIDPVAAREVLRSGIPVTLVGLDATNDVPVTAFTWNALRRYRRASTAATVAWDVMTRSGMFMGGQYFWDPLAATAVVRPGMLRFADRRLDVVTAPGADTGRVVETTRGALVRLAIGADRAAFERQLMRTLTRRPRLMLPKPPRHPVLTCDVRRCSYAGPHRATTGQGAFETVNDASTATTYVFGRLIEGRTIADLRRYVRGLGVLGWRPPSWFAMQATGTTPPHSTMTWVVSIPRPGDMALLATTGAQTRVVAPIRIRAAR